jgi:hypothetical protein
VEVHVTSDEADGTVAVRVQVRLDVGDQRRVFTSGDHLVQLPCAGLVPAADGAPMERSSIFLTELAGSPSGLTRVFADRASADAFAADVAGQLEDLRHRLEGA